MHREYVLTEYIDERRVKLLSADDGDGDQAVAPV